MNHPKQILVVDDEIKNLKLMESILEVLGHSSKRASNGFEALEQLKSGIDLVLLDVMMPGIDGFEVARRIRGNQDSADIPIIMVTVLDDRDSKINAIRAGANDFVCKPIDRLDLSVRIDSLLKMKEAQDLIKRHKAELERTVEKRTLELIERENLFRSVFDAAQDCIFIKDKSLKYTAVNKATADLVEIDKAEMLGKTDRELFGDAYGMSSEKVESRVLQGQTIENQENILIKSQSISLDVCRFPLRNSDGETTGLCCIARELMRPYSLAKVKSFEGHEYKSEAMLDMLEKAEMAAKSESLILLTGETGSGKDYLARYIHDRSSRAKSGFYAVNCAAIPGELAESELFGHEAGSFTGAMRRKRGMVEMSEGGTLLLNEIGELTPIMQAKLLTFLDTFSFTRVGGEREVTVDTRLIAATNRNLDTEVDEGQFRKDLFYRISVFNIRVPPLRDRREDIQMIANNVLERICAKMNLASKPRINSRALTILSEYHWPGNVRELKNVLERALIVSGGGVISDAHLGFVETDHITDILSQEMASEGSFYRIISDAERKLIENALGRTNGKKNQAARLLGISRFALVRHMAKLGIN